MNITNAYDEVVVGDHLESIFNRQKELMDKYHDIELRSGLMQTEDCPVNLDDKRGQARLKDFAWRVMEEIGEAIDSIYTDNDVFHFKEEMVDGLHFFVEFSILSGLDNDKLRMFLNIPEDVDCLEYMFNNCKNQSLNLCISSFVQNLGMTCNCLKNKPWKQSQMLTDRKSFYEHLSKAWMSYMFVLRQCFHDHEELTNVYLKKSQVNKFRQRSNY